MRTAFLPPHSSKGLHTPRSGWSVAMASFLYWVSVTYFSHCCDPNVCQNQLKGERACWGSQIEVTEQLNREGVALGRAWRRGGRGVGEGVVSGRAWCRGGRGSRSKEAGYIESVIRKLGREKKGTVMFTSFSFLFSPGPHPTVEAPTVLPHLG